jgi:membrane fusion protein, heavy metal efflux system
MKCCRFFERPILFAAGIVILSTFPVLSSCTQPLGSAARAEDPAGKKDSQHGAVNSNTILLSAAEQEASHLGIEPVFLSEEAERVRVPGRIALPDNAMWRVGVLTDGRVQQVYVNSGDFVHQGQVLARMHSHEIHEARAAYEIALAERARLVAAQSLAEKNYARMQRLYGLKAASLEQTEQARQELLNAQTSYQKGEVAVGRERSHLEDNLGIPADRSTDERDELIPIIAPASGYVLQKNVTPGATIQPSTDAFVLGNLAHLWMLASVSADKLSLIRLGEPAAVSIQDLAGRPFRGSVANLGQQFDPTTRLIQIRIELENTGSLLRSEMLATAELPLGVKTAKLLISQDAIQQVNGQDIVFLQVASDRFAVRPVRIGDAIQNKLQILEGVQAGDRVVTRGSFILKSQLLKSSIGGE